MGDNGDGHWSGIVQDKLSRDQRKGIGSLLLPL